MADICWMCEKDLGWVESELIKTCPNCGVENDRTPYIPYEERRKDMPFENDSGGKQDYLKLPKEGQSYDFSQHGEITKIEKVANPDKTKGFNFQKSIKVKAEMPDGSYKDIETKEDCGYFYLLEFSDKKKLTLSSWSPFYAMKEAEVKEGDSIMINHKGKGEWIIEKL